VTDLDGLLRGALHRHAEEAPVGADLLAAVHRRSRRLARRRRLAVVGGAALLAALSVPALAAVPHGGAQPAATPHSPAPAPSADRVSAPPSAAPSSTAPRTSTPDPGVRLQPPAYVTPVFPFRPTVTPVGGLAPPEVTLAGGELVASYAANDPVAGADVDIRVGPRPPGLTDPADHAGPVQETPHQVRGHPGTLRRVVVAPANRLSLYWPEAPGQWVRVDTDDTLTDAQLVRLADALAPAAVPVVTPFRFDLVPAGMVLDTSSRSEVAFRPPGGTALVDCALVGPRPLTGPTVRVGGYDGVLHRTATGATLTVALDDRGETLVVQVPAEYPISDADLTRFAAGVHPTRDAEARR
jgi:hypothetical protein